MSIDAPFVSHNVARFRWTTQRKRAETGASTTEQKRRDPTLLCTIRLCEGEQASLYRSFLKRFYNASVCMFMICLGAHNACKRLVVAR